MPSISKASWKSSWKRAADSLLLLVIVVHSEHQDRHVGTRAYALYGLPHIPAHVFCWTRYDGAYVHCDVFLLGFVELNSEPQNMESHLGCLCGVLLSILEPHMRLPPDIDIWKSPASVNEVEATSSLASDVRHGGASSKSSSLDSPARTGTNDCFNRGVTK